MHAHSCKLIRLTGLAVQGIDEADKNLENFRQWKFQLSETGLKMVQCNSQDVVKKV